MREIDQIIEDAQGLAGRVEALVAELKLLRKSLKKGEGKDASPVYVRPDGRLTEAGVRYCHAAFAAAKGPSEIARVLGVTVPAVIARRRSWEAGRGKTGKPGKDRDKGSKR